MLHNYKLNNKIKFLLESNISAGGMIQPVSFDQHQVTPATWTVDNYPIPGTGPTYVKPKPEIFGPPPPPPPMGEEVDLEELFQRLAPPGSSPALYERFKAWFATLTPADIALFTADFFSGWALFWAQLAYEFEFDPLSFGHPNGNYPHFPYPPILDAYGNPLPTGVPDPNGYYNTPGGFPGYAPPG